MNLRTAPVCFALLFATLPASGQNPKSLAADLAALTARVAKLEGQIVAADLAGTYTLHGFQTELRVSGVPGGLPAQVASYVFAGTVVLAADGTLSFTGTESGHRLVIGTSASLSPHQLNASSTLTWTYADGIVTFSGGGPSLSVAAGGRILASASANPSDGTNVILVLTRLR